MVLKREKTQPLKKCWDARRHRATQRSLHRVNEQRSTGGNAADRCLCVGGKFSKSAGMQGDTEQRSAVYIG